MAAQISGAAFGIPTDDTYRVVMGNINTEHFYQVTVQMLLHMIEDIVVTVGETGLHPIKRAYAPWSVSSVGLTL